jgi:hypothetical protein
MAGGMVVSGGLQANQCIEANGMNIVKSRLLKRIAELEARRRRGSLARLSDADLEMAIIAMAADYKGEPLNAEMKKALAKVPAALPQSEGRELAKRRLDAMSDEQVSLWLDASVAWVTNQPISQEGLALLDWVGTAPSTGQYPRPASQRSAH